MTGRPQHETLVDHLRRWTPAQVAELLRRRPDLVQPRPPSDVAELAQVAQAQHSLRVAVEAATLAEHRLLQVIVCAAPGVALSELAAVLPPGIDVGDIEEPLASLEASALVWRHQGRLHSSEALHQVTPTTFGPALRNLATGHTVDYLKGAIVALRRGAAQASLVAKLPPRAMAPDGRPARKAELVDELESLLGIPALVEAVLAGAPAEALALARTMAEGHPVIDLTYPLYHSIYGLGRHLRNEPAYWLFERGLVFPYTEHDRAVQPREVGLSLRGGRPVDDLALVRPELITATVEPEEVDRRAGTQAARTLDRLADLLDRWAASPARALKAGGLGATVMKQTAAALETDRTEAARLVELANLAGLVVTTMVSRRENRRAVVDSFVGPVPAASAWLDRSTPQRWCDVAWAWLEAEHWPSALGDTGTAGGSGPVLSGQIPRRAAQLRRRVLDALTAMDPGSVTTVDALAARVYWDNPQPWPQLGAGLQSTTVGWIYAEAELLGVVADGSLSSFGRRLVADDRGQAVEALAASLPEPVTSFTLQADLTATVVGSLDRPVARELRLMADVESTGAATTLRFSESTLRRAVDAGRDEAAILAFLETHAAKGVPGPLAYLVADVDRRYGHLLVGSATSVITSEDPAVLADACSHKRTRKLGLRLLAPTVAVSTEGPAKVMDGLRAAGFLPAGEQGDATVALPIPMPAKVAKGPGGAEDGSAGLSPPYRPRPATRRSTVPAVDESTAIRLAEAILDGVVVGTKEPADELLASVLTRAIERHRVLGIVIDGDDEDADPRCVAVTDWVLGKVIGIDLADGASIAIDPESMASVVDLGPLDEFANLALLDTARNRSGRRRR